MTRATKRKTRLSWIAMLIALATTGNGAALAQTRAVDPVAVPRGRHILVDGKLGPGEWADARRFEASRSITLYFKRDTTYLYVGVQASAGIFSTDLYLDRGAGTRILNLHASAKLGEREGAFEQWPEWVWWNNRGWAANVVRVANFEPREFLTDDIKEYQIEVGRLAARRVWLSADLQGRGEAQSIPTNGTERYGRHWLELRF